VKKVLVSAALAGVVAVTATGPAMAASPGVTVPGHPATAVLTLLGASPSGVVVQQDAATSSPSGFPSGPHIFSGAEGTRLGRRTAMETAAGEGFSYPSPAAVVTVLGSTVAWYSSARYSACNCNWQSVHRMNVLTGADVADGQMPPPLAYTPGSWYSDQIGSFSTYPFPPGGLKRYTPTAGQSFLPSTMIVPDSGNSIAMATDGTTGLLATYTLSDPTNGDSPRTYRLDLVDLSTGTLTLVAQGPDLISSVALSPDMIAWASQADGQPAKINQRARSGGATTSYTDTDGLAAPTKLAIAQGKVGYLAGSSGAAALRIVTGASARTVALPAGSSGFGTDGTRFLTAASGDPAVAGVYGVTASGTGGATRVATVPPATFELANLTLSGGRLHYTDASLTDKPGSPLWMRTVTGNNHPVLGAETLMSLPTGNGVATYAGASTSFSDARAAVGTAESGGIRLFDHDEVTGIIPDTSAAPTISGPYTLVGPDVFLADGEHFYSIPSSLTGMLSAGDIYGSSVAFALQDPGTRALTIYEDDAAATNPRLLSTITPPSDEAGCVDPRVSIWGEKVAWSSCDGHSLSVQNVLTGDVRTVAAAATDLSPLLQLQLGEGTLAWNTRDGVQVLDLTSPGSHTVTLPGAVTSFALDDHRIALLASGTATVQQLPFGNVKYRPRLIGTYALHGFTPGSGPRGTWQPQFDVSKPLRKVELTITAPNGKKVTTLDGTAPDGSIRDLSWDGRDRKGTAVGSGVYTWTLTARADDGDGQLVGPAAEPAVTGSVEVDAAN
jgi:hypothetical protein